MGVNFKKESRNDCLSVLFKLQLINAPTALNSKLTIDLFVWSSFAVLQINVNFVELTFLLLAYKDGALERSKASAISIDCELISAVSQDERDEEAVVKR